MAYLHPPQTYSVRQAQKQLFGLNAYFAVCNDRRAAVHFFMNIVRSSMAKTFAAKFKLDTQRKVYRRAGPDLRLPLKTKSWVGATDETQVKQAYAKQSSSPVEVKISSLPYIPYTKYKFIPKPDFRVSYDGLSKNCQTLRDPYDRVDTVTLTAKSALLSHCLRCGARENIEMHHVRRLRYLTQTDWIKRRKISLNRKMIPLCRRCHKITHGCRPN